MKRILIIVGLLISTAAMALTINGELKQAELERLTADPTAHQGRLYFNTVTNLSRIYDGTAWANLGGATTSLSANNVEMGTAGNTRGTANTNILGNVFADTTTGLTVKLGSLGNNEINASAAIAGTKIVSAALTTTGVVTSGTQTFGGLKLFDGGINPGARTTSDTNLGTISSVRMSKFYIGSFPVTFSGPFTTNQTITVKYVYIGDSASGVVSLFFPGTTSTAATSTQAVAGAGSIPSGLVPGAGQDPTYLHVPITAAGAAQQYGGFVQVSNDGSITIRRDQTSTTWSNTSTNGWGRDFQITYTR